MKWWTGLLPYFVVRMLAFKVCERFSHDGITYYNSVGNDFICRKEASPLAGEKRGAK